MTLIEPAREQMSQDEVIGKLRRQRRQEKRGSRRRPPGAEARKPERIWLKCVINCRGPGVGYRKRMSPGGCGCVEGGTVFHKPHRVPEGKLRDLPEKVAPGLWAATAKIRLDPSLRPPYRGRKKKA